MTGYTKRNIMKSKVALAFSLIIDRKINRTCKKIHRHGGVSSVDNEMRFIYCKTISIYWTCMKCR